MITEQTQQKIISAMLHQRTMFTGSDAKYATSLGIHKSAYAQLKSGKIVRVLSEARWLAMARRLNVTIGNEAEWHTANTAVHAYITEQLSFCQRESSCGIFCDKADIGKTHAAKVYARSNKSAVYIDCSQVKSKQKLIRHIAREFGVDHTGKYSDVYEDLAYYLKAIETPLIILDESGDLDYSAFLELKALWNATEGFCGWYQIGADGLKKKIERGIGYKKVGFAEIFRRYGSRYQKLVPAGSEDREQFLNHMAAQIIRANLSGKPDIDQLLRKTNGSLTRIRTEVKKIKRNS